MKNIIFVGGVHGRSGTNIMKRMVCTHPKISWVLGDETRYLEFLADLLPHLLGNEVYLPRNAGLQFNRFKENIIRRFGDKPIVRNLLEEIEDILALTKIKVPRFETFPLINSQTMKQLNTIMGLFTKRLFGKMVINSNSYIACEKTPSNAQYIELANNILPDAHMIVMIRHPLDTALSFLPPDWGPDDPIDAAHFTHEYHTRWRYVSCRVPKSYYQLVRFEDLLNKPMSQMKRIGDFTGLKWGEKNLNKSIALLKKPIIRRKLIDSILRNSMNEILEEDIEFYNSLEK